MYRDGLNPPDYSARRRVKSPRSKRLEKRLKRLTKPVRRTEKVGPIVGEVICSLVDLAFWSSSGEVRGQAASLLATLSQNRSNAEALRKAGAIKALVALMRMGDTVTLTDSLCAIKNLSCNEQIRQEFLQSQANLKTLFHLGSSENSTVRREAIGAIYIFSKFQPGPQQLVNGGVLKTLYM